MKFKTRAIATSTAQAPAQPTVSALEQAVLDLPELQYWFRADRRAGSASRLSYRDAVTGALISGYGGGRMGSGINGLATYLTDNMADSRLLTNWQLPASYSVIALYRLSAYPVSPSLASLLIDDAGIAQATPQFAFGPTNVSNQAWLKHQQSGAGSHVVDTTALSLSTNYITYASFDGNTLQAGIGTNVKTAGATATLAAGYDGATRLWIGGGAGSPNFTFAGEIAHIIVLNVPIHERTAYGAQADAVLNYLANISGITLGA